MKYLTLFLIMFFMLDACQNNSENTNKIDKNKEQIVFTKEGKLTVTDSEGQTKAVFDVEFARDDYERETGLMYRESMQDDQAMLFIFDDEKPRYFWMKNTYIPLDIIYIDAGKKIVKIIKNTKPLDEMTLPSIRPAKYVLEIKAGLSDAYGFKESDKVAWQIIHRD